MKEAGKYITSAFFPVSLQSHSGSQDAMALLQEVKLRNSAAQALGELKQLLGDRLSTA
jgi:hypothetical protein